MKTFIAILLLTYSVSAFAEKYICTYPGYLSGSPVTISIDIMGDVATVKGSSKHQPEYKVVENNDFGAILVLPIAREVNQIFRRIEVGMFGIAIDKTKMKMIRGNIIHGEEDKGTSISGGPCTH